MAYNVSPQFKTPLSPKKKKIKNTKKLKKKKSFEWKIENCLTNSQSRSFINLPVANLGLYSLGTQ